MNLKTNINHPVRTIIVYPSNVSVPQNVYTNTGNLLFSVEQISLNNLYDSNDFLSSLEAEAARNRNPFLSEENVVKLALAPLGRVSGDRGAFVKRSLLLANQLFGEPSAVKAFALIAVAGSNILGTGDLSNFILEVIGMEGMRSFADEITGGFITSLIKEKEAEKARIIRKSEAEKALLSKEKDKTNMIIKALKMKLNNVDLQIICEHTGLSKKEIENI
jgi:hypothetical protein